MELSFYKYQGTGNDFIIADNRTEKFTGLSEKKIKFLCDRRFGIGADGLMLLNNKAGYDFEMVYYNADGKPGSMCGNGGRCMIRFAKDIGIDKSTFSFLAVDGPHEGDIDPQNIIRLKMQDVSNVENHQGYAILNTGSPHYIQFSTGVRKMDVFNAGKNIRYSDLFKKDGINVNFVEWIGAGSIYMRTYERGVEAETLSCGTGVTAAALMSAPNAKGFNNVFAETNGGKLSIEFNKIDDKTFRDIYLCGPAEFVFRGTINLL